MTALAFRTGWGEARFVQASHGATRLERLERLHGLAVNSELRALPCTEDRHVRGVRADRIAQALRAAQRAQAVTSPCAACGQPARPSSGLCERCREGYEAEMESARAWWMGEGL